MTIDEIKELIRVVHETGIAELEVQRGENRVWIKGPIPLASEVAIPAAGHATGIYSAASGPSPAPTLARPIGGVPQLAQVTEEERYELVKSPIVGTYYDAPSPGAPVFVKIGDRVEPKQVLCIIESMKLMNEIEADEAGVVVAKHVESGRPVEYGELLFTIRPL